MLIIPYKTSWAIDFAEIKDVLSTQLQSVTFKIEHIGSTSVTDLSAKPIIDIDIIYFEPGDFIPIKHQLEELGYDHNGDQGIPGREVFKRKNQNHKILDSKPHHLYVCHCESSEVKKHLLFRDHLRANKEAREQYSNLKKELAVEANQTKKLYAALKESKAKEFINKCIEKQLSNEK